jgi:hypothetical protein
MPSLFDEIEAASQAAITYVYGDGIRIRPMKGDGNYGGSPDPNRPVKEVAATFSSAPNVGAIDYPGTQSNGAPAALSPSEIWIDRAQALTIGYELKRGDVIERVPSGASYRVAQAEAGDHGDIRVVLVR